MRESGVRAENGVSASNLHRCRTADAPRPETWGERGGDRRDAPCLGPVRSDRRDVRPLAHHCMDVAAAFAETMRPPVVRDRLDEASVFHSMTCSAAGFPSLPFCTTSESCTRDFRQRAGRRERGGTASWPSSRRPGFPALGQPMVGAPVLRSDAGHHATGRALFSRYVLRPSPAAPDPPPLSLRRSPTAETRPPARSPFQRRRLLESVRPSVPLSAGRTGGGIRNALDSASCAHASHGAAASSPSRAAVPPVSRYLDKT